MMPEEELFEVRYNNWMYHLWTDFVTPPDSWCPLDLNMARTPGIRSAHITNMLTKLHHITWCPFFPKIKSSTITYLLIKIRVVIRKKEVMWEKFPSGGPPSRSPQFGNFHIFLPFFFAILWAPESEKKEKNMDSLTTCDHPYWNTYIISGWWESMTWIIHSWKYSIYFIQS